MAASLSRGWLETGAAVGLAWGGGVVPVTAGTAQTTRVMDALACLTADDTPLADVLAGPAVRAARVGVRVVVTTDTGAARLGPTAGVGCVVLRRGGFGGDPVRLPVRPWLDIPSPSDVPHQLRHGTPEAAHGC